MFPAARAGRAPARRMRRPSGPSLAAGGSPASDAARSSRQQRQTAEEVDAELLRRGLRAAAAERLRFLAAMRAGVARHILDQAEHRHRHLAEQVDRRASRRSATAPAGSRRSPRRPAAISGSATAARRRCPAAGRRPAARHPPNWPRPAAPARPTPSARARPARGRPTPAGRATGSLMPWAVDRVQPLVVGGRLLVGAEQFGLRRPVDVGVDQPDLLAHSRQRDGEVGGQRRLADAALAAGDGDQLAPRSGRR